MSTLCAIDPRAVITVGCAGVAAGSDYPPIFICESGVARRLCASPTSRDHFAVTRVNDCKNEATRFCLLKFVSCHIKAITMRLRLISAILCLISVDEQPVFCAAVALYWLEFDELWESRAR